MKGSLALRTIRHDWRRFLPAILAVAVALTLVVVQTAFVAGIFRAASLPIDTSPFDLWLGSRATATFELGETLARGSDVPLRRDPDVARVERIRLFSADWRGPGHGSVSVFVVGIETGDASRALGGVLPLASRRLLRAPHAAVVDPADLDTLGVAAGGCGRADGYRLCVAGTVPGLRALAGVNVVTSLATAGALARATFPGQATWYAAALADPARATAAVERIRANLGARRVDVWSAATLSSRTRWYWLLDTGAGVVVLVMSIVIAVAGAVIASQALLGALASSTPEFATLHALGVDRARLGRIALAHAGWVALFGGAIAAVLAAVTLGLAAAFAVPVAFDPAGALLAFAALAAVLAGASVAALRTIRRVDAAALLR